MRITNTQWPLVALLVPSYMHDRQVDLQYVFTKKTQYNDIGSTTPGVCCSLSKIIRSAAHIICLGDGVVKIFLGPAHNINSSYEIYPGASKN